MQKKHFGIDVFILLGRCTFCSQSPNHSNELTVLSRALLFMPSVSTLGSANPTSLFSLIWRDATIWF